MNSHSNWKLHKTWSVFLALSCIVCGTCVWADEQQQAANGNGEDLCGVVRVSWKLIDAIADDQVTVEVPFKSHFSRGTATGYVESQVDVTIQPVQTEPLRGGEVTVFRFKVEGNAQGHFVAQTGRFQIAGPISIPFSAEREVSFDGRFFSVSEASIAASVKTRFRTIRGFGNGPLGRGATILATPTIERRRTSAERQASSRARRYVTESVNRYTQAVVSKLNEVTPIEESLFRLYPDMAKWPIRISADSDYLVADYAPPGSPPVQLPGAVDKHAAIEIWIRTTAAEAKFLERLGNWKQSQDLLAKCLPGEGSHLASLTHETTARSFGPWFVLLIGTSQTASLAQME